MDITQKAKARRLIKRGDKILEFHFNSKDTFEEMTVELQKHTENVNKWIKDIQKWIGEVEHGY